MKKYPTQTELRELFDYHPDGYLVFKERFGDKKWAAWNAKYAGKIAGRDKVTMEGSFFYYVTINNKGYSGAKLIWILLNGDVPDGFEVNRKEQIKPPTIDNLFLRDGKKGIKHNRMKKNSCNEFIGVRKRDKNSNFFICERKKCKLYFKNEIDAATHYDNLVEDETGVRPNMTERRIVESVDNSYGKYFSASMRSISNSGIVGVHKKRDKYAARFRTNNLGCFKTQEEAARAYNIAAYEHYGENAVLNDIPFPLGDVF